MRCDRATLYLMYSSAYNHNDLSHPILKKKFQISSDSPVHDNEDVSMATAGVKAGHFTNVYLNSLQKSTQ